MDMCRLLVLKRVYFIDFGGTSGAAPQVVAALADVLSILHTLNRDEAATLLRRTAVVSSYGDGVGTLNRYKLVRVAQRLLERGWPTSKVALHDDSVYDFSDEAQALLAASFSAVTSVEAFVQLRQAFFLTLTIIRHVLCWRPFIIKLVMRRRLCFMVLLIRRHGMLSSNAGRR